MRRWNRSVPLWPSRWRQGSISTMSSSRHRRHWFPPRRLSTSNSGKRWFQAILRESFWTRIHSASIRMWQGMPDGFPRSCSGSSRTTTCRQVKKSRACSTGRRLLASRKASTILRFHSRWPSRRSCPWTVTSWPNPGRRTVLCTKVSSRSPSPWIFPD